MMDDPRTLPSPEITQESLCADIKEEPAPCIEGNMEPIAYTSLDHPPCQHPGNPTSPDVALPRHSTEAHPSPLTEEEPVWADTAHLTNSSLYIQYLPSHVKAEEERCLTAIYIPTTPTPQYPSAPIKEELVLCDGGQIPDIYSITDPTVKPAPTEAQKLENTKINEIEVIYQHPTQSTFGDISNLTKYQRTYSRKKTPQCAECGEYFLRKAQLVTHQRLHLGQNPLQCPECGRTFSRTSQLINHQKYHKGKKSF
ncbi:zinc finger protein with KRAB and SCAN domains 4-like [Eleutherodactylus coqui]|uniref:zinc finger protein with KRAB and SCAN domains 4-like n=1 Tax=Eleutherodactylus coqui TaxID=57060 RepID=UPI0034619B0F